jgi:hypothetical protein
VTLTNLKTVALTAYTLLIGSLLVASQSPGGMVLGVGLCGLVGVVVLRGLGATTGD